MKYQLKSFFIAFIVSFVLITICDSNPTMYTLSWHAKNKIQTFDHFHSIPLGNLYANIVISICAGVLFSFAHNFWRILNGIYAEVKKQKGDE